MLPRESAQDIPWANFQQNGARILAQLRDASRKLHGLAEMPSPVGWVRRFLRRDPLAGDAGNVGNVRRVQMHLRNTRGKRLNERIHHGRMEGVRSDEPATGNAFAAQFLLKFFQRVEWPGDDAQARCVHCGKSESAI